MLDVLEKLVGVGEIFEGVLLFPQTVIDHCTVMRNDCSRLSVGILLVGRRLIQLLQCRLEGMRHPTLDCPHGLLGQNNSYHLRLCQLLIQLAGTVEIDLPSTVSLLSTLFECTSACKEGQGRSLAMWQVAGEESLDAAESLSEVPPAFQGNDGIQWA